MNWILMRLMNLALRLDWGMTYQRLGEASFHYLALWERVCQRRGHRLHPIDGDWCTRCHRIFPFTQNMTYNTTAVTLRFP